MGLWVVVELQDPVSPSMGSQHCWDGWRGTAAPSCAMPAPMGALSALGGLISPQGLQRLSDKLRLGHLDYGCLRGHKTCAQPKEQDPMVPTTLGHTI